MATQTEIVNRVRRRIADFKESRLFSDDYYYDAIDFALSKLSYDFATTYSLATDVPDARVFLLTKLATIEMCYVRAANFVDSDGDGTTAESIPHSLKVPDLEIEGSGASNDSTADTWISLAQKLQNEYDDEIAHVGGASTAAEIGVGVLKRISLSTGGYRKYALDEGLAAVTVSAVVDVSDVTLTWSILYDETFLAYEVYRDTDATMVTEERIAYLTDNQDNTYEDESLASGTYYYRVKTTNPNGIKTNGNTLTVVIP